MRDDITYVKQTVRAILHAGFEAVPSARAASGKVHLEVWRSRGKRRSIGLEMGHDGRVNFWIVRPFGLPPSLPPSVERHDKQPKGDRSWIGPDGKGANSNLSGYDDFRRNPISRLEVKSEADARLVLDYLLT